MTIWRGFQADYRDRTKARRRCRRPGCGHARGVHQVGDGACRAHPGCRCPAFVLRAAKRKAHSASNTGGQP